MWNWLSELLEIRHVSNERKKELQICDSCEVLKLQLSIMNQNNQQLLNRILEKPVSEPATTQEEFQPINKHEIPFRVRREMLEKEDRARAKSLKLAAQPDSAEIDKLERELGITDAKA